MIRLPFNFFMKYGANSLDFPPKLSGFPRFFESEPGISREFFRSGAQGQTL